MHSGSITYDDYLNFFNLKIISSNFFNQNRIQPSSIDLTLSDECYEVISSFLSPYDQVRNKLKNFIKKKIDLKKGFVLKKILLI